jgi:lysophospholipase L1-like esterase
MFARSRSKYAYDSYSSYSSSSYGRKPKFPWLKVLPIAIPVGLLLLELLLRLGVGMAGKATDLNRYEGEAADLTNYRLHWLNDAGQPIDGLPNRGRLNAKRSDLVGYRLVGNQKLDGITINSQGFRADEPIVPTKPKDEIRIIVLGGSMAFGQMSPSNATTFSSILEQRLNQQVEQQRKDSSKFRPDVLPFFADELDKVMALPPRIRSGQYRVINAAVPGYSSANELAQLVQQAWTYQPDWVVVVNGYGDLLLPQSQQAAIAPINGLLDNSLGHWLGSMQQGLSHRVGQLYLAKVPQWLTKPQGPQWSIPLVDGDLTSQLPDAKSLEPRLARYRQNLERIAQVLSAAKVPLIVALQPELSHRTSPTDPEKAIVQPLGKAYTDRVTPAYSRLQAIHQELKQRYGLKTLDLNQSVAGLASAAFVDPIHLTPEANSAVAGQIYETIAPQLQVQPKPFVGDQP